MTASDWRTRSARSGCLRWCNGSMRRRIGTACCRSAAPDFLFLDEATASLDEPAEAALYRLLQERLPATTIVSIGHRSTLLAFHSRRLTLERDGNRHRVREAALQPAAE
jgi:putative ATP-binding cassette transporter